MNSEQRPRSSLQRSHARSLAKKEARSRCSDSNELTCYHCNQVMVTTRNHNLSLTVDHYPIPRCFGGKLIEKNVVASCKECNEKNGLMFSKMHHSIGCKLLSRTKKRTRYFSLADGRRFIIDGQGRKFDLDRNCMAGGSPSISREFVYD